MAENTTNTNQVRFLTGTQENLNNMSTSQVGTFYLTSDTNRLYVGAQEGGPVLLNKAVAVVQNIGELPTEGIDLDSFYYLKDENILCVYAKQGESAPEWIQINHQAITTNVVNDALTFELDETNTADSLKYNVTLTQQTYNPATGELAEFKAVTPAAGTLEIDKTALAGLVPEAASVGLTATEEDSGIVIKTSGDGSNDKDKISIVSDGLAEVSVDASNNIKISTASIGLKAVNDPQDLDGDGIVNSLTLTLESKDSAGKVDTLGEALVIKSGPGAELRASFIDRNKNTLQVSHAVITNEESFAAESGNYIKEITLQNGHVTGIKQEALPEDNDTTITSGTLDTDYKLVLTDSNGSSEVKIDLSQIYADAVDASTEMFNVVNQALLYKGVVSNAKDLAEKPITNGHMYKIGADFSVTSGEGEEQTTISYLTGDLIIAYKSKWEIVPSGDEVDTTYEGVVTTGDASIGYYIEDRNGGKPGEALTLNFGTGLAFDANGKTVSHATKTITPTTATASLSHGGSFSIPIISNDSQGHIDSIVNKTFTLPTETEYFFLATNNTISLADNNNGFHGSLTLASSNDNLNITATSDESYENTVYTFNLQWESFDPETSTT